MLVSMVICANTQKLVTHVILLDKLALCPPNNDIEHDRKFTLFSAVGDHAYWHLF